MKFKSVSLKENNTEILAIMAAMLCIIIVVLLFFKPVPTGNENLINILVGVILGSVISPVYGYYFGQSKKRDLVPEYGTETTITQSSKTEDVK